MSDDGFDLDPGHLDKSGGKLQQFAAKLEAGGSKMVIEVIRIAPPPGYSQ